MEIVVPVRRLRSGAELPMCAHSTEEDAGMDLSYCGDTPIMLPPGGRAAIGTGIALQLPSGFEGQIRARSGLALHRGLTVLNGPGTIDPGYRGEVSVILVNLSNEEQVIKPGDRIAQLVVAPFAKVRLSEVGDLDSSTRGEGGFGSSGT